MSCPTRRLEGRQARRRKRSRPDQPRRRTERSDRVARRGARASRASRCRRACSRSPPPRARRAPRAAEVFGREALILAAAGRGHRADDAPAYPEGGADHRVDRKPLEKGAIRRRSLRGRHPWDRWSARGRCSRLPRSCPVTPSPMRKGTSRESVTQELMRLGCRVVNSREVQQAIGIDQRDIDGAVQGVASSAATPRRRASRSRSASPNAREA